MQVNTEMDKEKWSALLCQTISAMCKSSINGLDVIRVQGLVGVTLCNKEVYLIDISEKFERIEENLKSQIKSHQKRKSSTPKIFKSSNLDYVEGHSSNDNHNETKPCEDFKIQIERAMEHVNSESGYLQPHYSSSINLESDASICSQQINNIMNNTNVNQNQNINNDSSLKIKSIDNNGIMNNIKNSAENFNERPENFKAPSSLKQLESFTLKEITPSVKKFRNRKEFFQTVATTKHTAEILGYQDFTPFSSRPYTCKLCDASFSKRFCLANHIVTVHQVGGKYVCEVCSRQFLQRNRYMLHIEKHLSDGSRLVCPQCGKNFTIKNNFQKHLDKCLPTSNNNPNNITNSYNFNDANMDYKAHTNINDPNNDFHQTVFSDTNKINMPHDYPSKYSENSNDFTNQNIKVESCSEDSNFANIENNINNINKSTKLEQKPIEQKDFIFGLQK